MPVIHCDGDDGECGAWDTDFYAGDVDTVDGVRITRSAPAPGWRVVGDDDLCPKHSGGADQ